MHSAASVRNSDQVQLKQTRHFSSHNQKSRASYPVSVQGDIKESNRSFYSVTFRLSAFLLMVVTSESQYGCCSASFTSSLQAGRRKKERVCQPSLFIFIRQTKTDPTEFHLHFTNENCVTRPNLARR